VLGSAIAEQREKGEWIEGVAIWVAIFLVTGVGEMFFFGTFLRFSRYHVYQDYQDS
jgi:Ca2+-transporting ATPase